MFANSLLLEYVNKTGFNIFILLSNRHEKLLLTLTACTWVALRSLAGGPILRIISHASCLFHPHSFLSFSCLGG